MNPDELRDLAQRDQFWASLAKLEPDIRRLADGEWDGNERDHELLRLLAKIVLAEMLYQRGDVIEPGEG